MGAATNNSSERVEIRMAPELKRHLQRLSELGLYGSSVSEVIRHLVTAEIRRLTRDGEVRRWIEDRRLLEDGAE